MAKSNASMRAGVSALAACRRERIQRSSTVRGCGRGAGRGVSLVADVQQHEARGVEELVGERLALRDLLLAEAHVLRGGHREQPEAHGVGAVGGELAALPVKTGGRGPPSIRSSGSMPVPSDLLIRRPSGAWMTEWT